MYCGRCGTQIEEGMAYCPECGAKVDGAVPVPPSRAVAAAPERRHRGWVTLLMCVLATGVVLMGEVVGYLVADALGWDVDVASVACGALAAALAMALMGGARMLAPTRGLLAEALRAGWWLLAVSLGLFVTDVASTVAEGSFVVSAHWPTSVAGVAVLCLAVSVMEECLFRGLILQGLLDALGRSRAGVVASVVVSSALFGMAHIDWGAIDATDLLSLGQAVLKTVQTGVFGVFMAALAIRSRSLVGPIVLHAASDFLLLVSYVGIRGLPSELDYVSLEADEAAATMMLYALIIVLYLPLLVRAVRMLREAETPYCGELHG